MMQRWWWRLRSLASSQSSFKPHNPHNHLFRPTFVSDHRLLHTSRDFLHKPINLSYPKASSILKFEPFVNASPFPHLSQSPLSLIQVRHITAKQRKRKLKSRKPATPVVSKVKKIKIKCYSSYKSRFRLMHDGNFRRWKEGKRHNAHLKSKKSKRRLRQPGIVPPAYAKVMKKLNFCG